MRSNCVLLSAFLILGGLSAQDVVRLERDLKSREASTRLAAANALAELGPGAAKALRALQTALADVEPSVATAAAVAMGRIGRGALKAIERSLADRRSSLLAIRALEELGPEGAELVPNLMLVLREETIELQQAAERAIERIGSAATPHLIPALKRRVSSAMAIKLLQKLGSDARQATPAVIALLEDGTELEYVLSSAATLLGTIKDPTAIPILTKLLGNPGADTVVHASVAALEQIGPESESAGPSLIAVLVDAKQRYTPESRSRAARALGAIGVLDPAATDALRAALAADDAGIRDASRAALALLDPPPGPDGQLPRLRHRNPKLRTLALVELGKLGDAALPHVHVLIECAANDADREVRLAALRSIATLGGPGAIDAKPLEALAEGPDEELASAARAALAARRHEP